MKNLFIVFFASVTFFALSSFVLLDDFTSVDGIDSWIYYPDSGKMDYFPDGGNCLIIMNECDQVTAVYGTDC